ncbi:MAG: twin-arginine translocase subunit TatC, partial [Candidatus Eisenbacteria sp.]|nr:twin-arginine translocase subunit TatC [Candidatus Eisenbacteria bacterium]
MKVPSWLARIRDPSAGAEMSFLDHLDELRSVLISSVVALLVLGIGGWFISGWLMDFLIDHAGLGKAQFIKPQEAFFTRFKISLAAGFIVGLPYIALQVWSFVVPGLLKREKRVVLPLVFWSTLLFLMGAAFSFLILTPIMLRFLSGFGTPVVIANLAVGYVLDFYIRMAIACGVLFQLPLVVAVLSFFGIVTPGFLKSMWRQAIIVILIASAIVTPADMLSQLVLGLPIILLYFASIFVSAAICRAKGDGEDGGDGED